MNRYDRNFFAIIIYILPLVCFSQLHISNVVSLDALPKTSKFQIADEYAFQYIIEEGVKLTDGSYLGTKNDFAGYIPIGGSNSNGYLCVNSENNPGGVAILDIQFDPTSKYWETTNSVAVDFSVVAGTGRNCSGGITPWNTLITSEEIVDLDDNGFGYNTLGWSIEIDPATAQVMNYSGGMPNGDKLWALGNFQHENAVVHSNQRTVYQGVDSSVGYLYKFVANQPGDLSSGDLYVYVGPKVGNGQWVQINNNTPAEQNSTLAQSAAVGGTVFAGIEDVELNPINGEIYFAVKNEDVVYKFTDDNPLGGGTTSNFNAYVGGVGTSYNITHSLGTSIVPWGKGNDNLAFDDLGNLYVQQDGGEEYIWLIGNNHTQANPLVKIIAISPLGSEPTGITFTPDFKYMFMSVQHPFSTNDVSSQLDANGDRHYFDRSVTLVLARKENLGNGSSCTNIKNYGTSAVSSGIYQANHTINSQNFVSQNSSVTMQANQLIRLDNGFEVELGGDFCAQIQPCDLSN